MTVRTAQRAQRAQHVAHREGNAGTRVTIAHLLGACVVIPNFDLSARCFAVYLCQPS